MESILPRPLIDSVRSLVLPSNVNPTLSSAGIVIVIVIALSTYCLLDSATTSTAAVLIRRRRPRSQASDTCRLSWRTTNLFPRQSDLTKCSVDVLATNKGATKDKLSRTTCVQRYGHCNTGAPSRSAASPAHQPTTHALRPRYAPARLTSNHGAVRCIH